MATYAVLNLGGSLDPASLPYLVFCTMLGAGVFHFFCFVVPSCASLLSRRRLPLLHSFSYPGAVLAIIHLGICVYVFFAITTLDDPGSVISGIGTIAVMNFWCTLLPSSKTSIVLWITGVPYLAALKYHICLSILGLAAAAVHVYLNSRSTPELLFSNDIVSGTPDVIPLFGMIAFITFGVMGLTAFEPIRRCNFELFAYIHRLLYPFGIIFLCLHSTSSILYGFMPGIILHGIDDLRQILKWMRPERVNQVLVLDDLTIITIHQPSLSFSLFGYYLFEFDAFKYKPGQFYFLNIKDVALFEWHPFSVARVHGGNMEFYIKSSALSPSIGSWTSTLHSLANGDIHVNRKVLSTFGLGASNHGGRPSGVSSSTQQHTASIANRRNTSWLPNISIDGPYGTMSIPLTDYASVSFLAGGIGITVIAASIQYLVDNMKEGVLQNVELHWTMREYKYLDVFSDQLGAIFEKATGRAIPLMVYIYCTNATAQLTMVYSFVYEMVNTRPPIQGIVSDLKKLPNACLVACGPMEMVRAAAGYAISAQLDFHEEIFAI